MLNMAGAEAGSIELKDEIFGITPNENAVHAVVKNYLANQRQGTQSAKTRGEVRGGGRKPFRQKGTGRHRQGSTTDPSQIGGGIVFAPKPRDYRYTLPKKLRRSTEGNHRFPGKIIGFHEAVYWPCCNSPPDGITD